MIIYNALIVNEGSAFRGYVRTEGGIITTVRGDDCPPYLLENTNEELIDAEGLVLLPGAIDTHVHFRDPGLTHKGDMESESLAAVCGGVTSFIDMPNTKPATVSIADIADKKRRAAQASYANYGFFIGATNDNFDELMRADYREIAGVKLFLGSSTGNMLVDSEQMLDRIFANIKAPIAVHAESEAIIRQNTEAAVAQYGDAANVPLSEHPAIRSRQACVESTHLALELARRHDARLHVCHVSTAEEAAMMQCGNVVGKRITAETCPHYLLFSENDYTTRGTRIKCNPAVKQDRDRKALLHALRENRIDTVATDHAPHLLEEKEGGALTASSGMPSVQFSVTLMLQLVADGQLSLPHVAEKMAHNPAIIFGIENRGFIREGYAADLVLVDMNGDPHKISDADVMSKCGWTPYAGIKVEPKIMRVWVNGQDARKEKFGQELRFKG